MISYYICLSLTYFTKYDNLRSIHVAADGIISFYGWVIFHCIYVSHLLHPFIYIVYIPSVQFSRSVMSDSLGPHGLQLSRPHCPLPTPGVDSNSCPLSRWCHPTISSSVAPFSCLQSFPASECFPMSQLFLSGGQSIGASASASVLPMNIQR